MFLWSIKIELVGNWMKPSVSQYRRVVRKKSNNSKGTYHWIYIKALLVCEWIKENESKGINSLFRNPL